MNKLSEICKGIPKGIIFDCDGVIIDSFVSNTNFYNKLRAAVDLPPMTEEQRLYAHQATGAEALNVVIPAPLMSAAMKVYHAIDYAHEMVPTLTINEGLHSLLETCYQHNIKLGIHTNRIIGMEAILEYNKLNKYFSPVVTPENFPPKPNPVGALHIVQTWKCQPSEVCFVGDSQNDCNTAQAANIPFVAFQDASLKHALCVNSFTELHTLLNEALKDRN